jgi:hypothetical protein
VSVDFEPVRVGDERRRIEPAVLVAGILVAALVVAVVKPWESANPSAPTSSPVAVAASSAPASPRPTPTTSPTPAPDDIDFWDVVAPILGVHDEWGVQALVADISSSTTDGRPTELGARWAPWAPSPDGADVTLEPGEFPAYSLGLTYPTGDAPMDARFWHVRDDGELEWIAAVALPAGPPGSPRLFIRTSPDAPDAWPTGTYRVDVLRDDGVARLTLTLAASRTPEPGTPTEPEPETGLVSPADSDPSAVRRGMFATIDGAGVPVDVAPARPLDEIDAWRAARQGGVEGEGRLVASAFLPRATGLGVMLTPHASVELAVLRRLAPSPLAPVPPARGGISSAQGRTPYVVFSAREGEALAPGVYALSVSWSDESGLHAGTWHVELLPGQVPTFN